MQLPQQLLIGLAHHEDGERGPSREGSATLSLPRLVIVLLPDVPSPLVLFDDVPDDRFAELVVDALGLLLVRTLGVGVEVERSHSQEVDVDPDGTSPVRRVVLSVPGHVEGGRGGEGAEAERGEELLGVGNV